LGGNVSIGGAGTTPAISVGDTGKAGLLVITGGYTQLSTATMNSFVGGSAVGTQYSQLQVGGTASLAGTLTVTLASGFTPTIGSTFTVLTAGAVSGTFSNSTIAINGSEHFNVSYTTTGVVLTVASGAASQSGGMLHAPLLAALPRKPQPILVSGMRHWAGATPKAEFLIASPEANHPRSGAIIARKYGFSESSKPLLAQRTNLWEQKASLVTPIFKPQAKPERVTQSMQRANNWNSATQSVFRLRVPTISMPAKRMPVRIVTPIMPRMGR
jgi:hypothetical protein